MRREVREVGKDNGPEGSGGGGGGGGDEERREQGGQG